MLVYTIADTFIQTIFTYRDENKTTIKVNDSHILVGGLKKWPPESLRHVKTKHNGQLPANKNTSDAVKLI